MILRTFFYRCFGDGMVDKQENVDYMLGIQRFSLSISLSLLKKRTSNKIETTTLIAHNSFEMADKYMDESCDKCWCANTKKI